MIVGWDFDAAIRLDPERHSPLLGALLRSLVERTPGLSVRILIWSEATIHAPGATLPLLIGDEWSAHPRIQVELDRLHPIYASHHQKIVTIDDEVAFVGGIDLTVDRWDTKEHSIDSPWRITPSGEPYGPVHDIQLAVEGPAARDLAEIARRRWIAATGESIAAHEPGEHIWPADLKPHLENVRTGISTASPRWRDQIGCKHSLQMLTDSIAAARDAIYIETQYFTSRRVGRAIAQALEKPTGPEILVVVGLNSHGFLEQYVMSANRDRLARWLTTQDPYNRFRIYHPVIRPGTELNVHSKVVIVDDIFLRIGSSNLNNRSEGLDTECDVSIEANSADTRATIAGVRNELLAEHLDSDAASVARAICTEGSLLRAVERLNMKERGLRLLPSLSRRGPTQSVFGTWFLDPARPLFPRG